MEHELALRTCATGNIGDTAARACPVYVYVYVYATSAETRSTENTPLIRESERITVFS
jgi:hypothetical protein